MAYDALFGRTDQYAKKKGELDAEFEQFTDEEQKAEDVAASSGGLDPDIQTALFGMQQEFASERGHLEGQSGQLEQTREELSEEISRELKKLGETQKRLDGLSGKKYTGGVRKASEKCQEYMDQLEKMMETLGGPGAEKDGPGGGNSPEIVPENDSVYNVSSIDQKMTGNAVMGKYPVIQGKHGMESDLLATNPNYSKTDSDSPWNNNCQRCVSAYEARRRGYDVEAQPFPGSGDRLSIMLDPQGWPTVYKGGKLIDCSANSGTGAGLNVEEQMELWGDNARAIVRVRWKPEYGGGGHVFIAERVNGKTHFIDPQNGETDVSFYFTLAKGSDVYCMRMDHLDFSDRIHLCCTQKNCK